MDPNDYDSEAEAEQASMAAMMGFTSFGPASKKRRYNPRADAGVDASLPDEDSGTGANTLPLMPRQPRGAVTSDEAVGQTEKKAKKEKAGGNADEIDLDDDEDEDPEPAYIDTSCSPARTGDGLVVPDLSLPSKPPQAGYGRQVGGYGRQVGGYGGQQSGQGKRIWSAGNYDPSSNENPWEFIEKGRGIEAVGRWLERGHAGGKERAG